MPFGTAKMPMNAICNIFDSIYDKLMPQEVNG